MLSINTVHPTPQHSSLLSLTRYFYLPFIPSAHSHLPQSQIKHSTLNCHFLCVLLTRSSDQVPLIPILSHFQFIDSLSDTLILPLILSLLDWNFLVQHNNHPLKHILSQFVTFAFISSTHVAKIQFLLNSSPNLHLHSWREKHKETGLIYFKFMTNTSNGATKHSFISLANSNLSCQDEYFIPFSFSLNL